MITALPPRVMNYRVSAASPTGELITVGQILAEAGTYAGTVLGREHAAFARRCAARLKEVVGELMSRRCIQSQDDLFEIPAATPKAADLSALSIDELHSLYRQWPLRHEARIAEGREHLTYYYEGRIVRELQTRKAANRDEQLKIDYCTAAYRNELANMVFILCCPVKATNDKIYPDSSRAYTPDELAALINRYANYRDITDREILVEYVDLALDLLSRSRTRESQPLLSALSSLARKNIIRIPALPTAKRQ